MTAPVFARPGLRGTLIRESSWEHNRRFWEPVRGKEQRSRPSSRLQPWRPAERLASQRQLTAIPNQNGSKGRVDRMCWLGLGHDRSIVGKGAKPTVVDSQDPNR